MGIQYLWHDHPLELRSVLSDAKAQCFVCQKPVSGYNYKCPKCNFFLHIPCLKLPLESAHPLHDKDHPLTLMNEVEPPDAADNHEILCNKCGSACNGFAYHCAACSFSLHLQCTLEQFIHSYEVHKHPLEFSGWPPSGFESFLCNICEYEAEEYYCFACEELREANHWVYYCGGCEFAAHKNCVVSELCGGFPKEGPEGFNLHEHLLGLITKIPS